MEASRQTLAVVAARFLALVVPAALFVASNARPVSETPMLLAACLLSFAGAPRTASGAWARFFVTRWGRRAGDALVVVILVGIGVWVYGPAVESGLAGHTGDWAINEAITRELYEAYQRGSSPRWLARISTGDPTPDLYMTQVHAAIARAACWAGGEASIHQLWTSVALFAQILAAVGVARIGGAAGAGISARVVVGTAALLDYGDLFTWGTAPLWVYGLVPSTLGVAVILNAVPSILRARTRLTTRRALAIAGTVGLATAIHPLPLLVSAALLAALMLALFVAPRAERGAALRTIGWFCLGLLISAFVWMPTAQRLGLYAMHFGTPQVTATAAYLAMKAGALPSTSFGALLCFAYFGGVFAWLVRPRAALPLVAALTLVALYVDVPFVDLGLGPSLLTVRLQSYRIGMPVTPLMFASAAPILASGSLFRATFAGREGARWLDALSVVAILIVAWTAQEKLAPSRDWLRTHVARTRELQSVPDPAASPAFAELVAYLRAENASTGPGQVARALYFADRHKANELLLAAFPGEVTIAPVSFQMPGLLLRDQPFDFSGENLDRFAIRWAIQAIDAPPVGTLASERRFGPYVVRAIDGWDGEVAHVRSGTGRVHVEAWGEDAVQLRLEASEPCLVELGVPYYPRWIASFHAPAGEEPLPVYARAGPAGERSERTLALWMRPGVTTLRPDGPLPSDRAGVVPSLLALAGIALFLPRPRSGRAWPRLHDALARGARGFERMPLRPVMLALGAGVVALLLIGQGATSRIAPALRLGPFFPGRVERLREGESALPCESDWLGRSFRCDDGTVVESSVNAVVRDGALGWALPGPGIRVLSNGRPPGTTAQLAIDFPQYLEGAYYAACENAVSPVLTVNGVEHALFHTTRRIEIAPAATRGARLAFTAMGPDVRCQLLRESAADFDRTSDVPWAPPSPPF